MHDGIKYSECSSSKIPTTIQAHETIIDEILPCYALTFIGRGWIAVMLPSPPTMSDVNFGFFMPVQFGDQTVNYDFQFNGHICVTKAKDAPCVVVQ